MADSLSKISAMLESARALTLEAASSASARLMDESPMSSKDISLLLNGRSDRDKLSGMKQVISMLAKGRDVSEFFADVIKNISSNNLETRKLVYTYLLRYADHEPDLALLSINTIQKTLGDKSPELRALAIRVMSGIRVPVIAQIITLAIKQCANDLSPMVRRAAAQSIAKCYELDPSNVQQLLELLQKLLNDHSPTVVGTALIALNKILPDRLDLMHPVYRKVCRFIHEFDEWAQIAALDMLTKYARLYIAKPRRFKRPSSDTKNDQLDAFYSGSDASVKLGEEVDLSPEDDDETDVTVVDSDLELLFSSVQPLLFSRNGCVVLEVAKLYYYLGSSQTFERYKVAGPVSRLLRSDVPVQHVALSNIRTMSLKRARSFRQYLTHFFVFPSDPFPVAKLKIETLTLLFDKSNMKTITSELQYYALTSFDQELISEAMRALGRCASTPECSPAQSEKILKWLLKQVQSPSPAVVSEALSVIRVLVQRDFQNQIPTVVRLSKSLSKPIVSSAKASIIWLVGELCSLASEISVEVLRVCTKDFAAQDEIVRYQIVLLAAKVYSCFLDRQKSEDNPPDEAAADIIPKLFNHVMYLARYDTSYDTRDRARMFSSLLTSSISNDIATLVLQAPKPCPVFSLREMLSGSTNEKGITTTHPADLMLDSTSLVVGHPLDSYKSIPPWTDRDSLVDPSVRDEEESTTSEPAPTAISSASARVSSYPQQQVDHGVVNGRKLTQQTLEEFFGDIDDENNESEEEESSSGEEDDEDDDDEGEEEEEEEDDGNVDNDSDREEEEESESESDTDEKSSMLKSA
jgi:AP-3 complex subunit beta